MNKDSREVNNPFKIILSEERSRVIRDRLTAFYKEEFDESLSAFRAERLLEFFLKTLGPPLYNQAMGDARAFMQQKLEDLDAEFYCPEEN
jgi:uncharacterized protein (DUF2164 family)